MIANKFQQYMMDHPFVYLIFFLTLMAIAVAIRCWIGGEPLIRLPFLD